MVKAKIHFSFMDCHAAKADPNDRKKRLVSKVDLGKARNVKRQKCQKVDSRLWGYSINFHNRYRA